MSDIFIDRKKENLGLVDDIKTLFGSECKHIDDEHFYFIGINFKQNCVTIICPINRGRFSIIGSGTIKDGENIMVALERELKEEVGIYLPQIITVDTNKFLAFFNHNYLKLEIDKTDDAEGVFLLKLFKNSDVDHIIWSLHFLSVKQRDPFVSYKVFILYLRCIDKKVEFVLDMLIEYLSKTHKSFICDITKNILYLYKKCDTSVNLIRYEKILSGIMKNKTSK